MAELCQNCLIDPFAPTHYRNKMEFSFTLDDSGQISLAFFKRGHRKIKVAVSGCELAQIEINKIAAHILQWIKSQRETCDLTSRFPLVKSLKSLIIRSDGQGHTLAAIFIKDKIEFIDFPKLNDNMVGFSLFYSTHKSPASVPTELMYKGGREYLEAQINGRKLRFGLFSFFQINIPVFKEVLADMAGFLEADRSVVDFYSGVGAISLSLSDKFKEAALVDNCEESIQYAQENILLNKITNCTAQCLPAEKITELIAPDSIVIFDPPRCGLHPKVIERVVEVKPYRIIYLSCNPKTQEADIAQIMKTGRYIPAFSKSYDFFPRTTHKESLRILESRSII